MKRITYYLLLFSLFFCLESVAQKVQNQEPLASKSTRKGRKELRREQRVHNAMIGLAAQNERKARKEHKLGTANHHDSKAKKLDKDRRKAKEKKEREDVKAAKAESKKGREEKGS